MRPILKQQPFRSNDLKRVAIYIENCQNPACAKYIPGGIVGCHAPSSLSFGGGTGFKGDDLMAYLCLTCHAWLDNSAAAPYEERLLRWYEWMRRSVITLFRLKILKVVV